MDNDKNIQLGGIISKLINNTDLTEEESYEAFSMILADQVSDMQQGAFLAALTGKGEKEAEVAGGWRAVYELDTTKVTLSCQDEIVDNCGTGMDSFKTFNISTAASVIGAAGGVKIARHGSRAITSSCGTVDVAERLGVDVECDVEIVAKSIEQVGLGLFNGMSPFVHPTALGRILSQIRFGSPLNIAASLANPALPKKAVRGVYSRELLRPVAEVMRKIGYTNAFILYGAIDGSERGMDEASVCGTTYGARLQDDTITMFSVQPEDCGITKHKPDELAPEKDRHQAAQNMVSLLSGRKNGAQRDAILLNSAFIFLLSEKTETLQDGIRLAEEILNEGKAMQQLKQWVTAQNSDPEGGLATLNTLQQEVLQ